MKYLKKNLFLILLLVCESACGFKNIDFLKMSNCALPCWNQIYIGETTKAEVIDTISNLPFIDPQAIYTTPLGNNFISEKTVFDTRNNGLFNTGSDVTAYYSNNTVEKLDFNGGINRSIDQIIQMIGEPEYIYTGRADVSGRIFLRLFSPSQGFDYGFVISDPNGEITRNNVVDYFEIFNPKLYDEFVKNSWFPYQDTTQLYKWQGYGSIKKLYWPLVQP